MHYGSWSLIGDVLFVRFGKWNLVLPFPVFIPLAVGAAPAPWRALHVLAVAAAEEPPQSRASQPRWECSRPSVQPPCLSMYARWFQPIYMAYGHYTPPPSYPHVSSPYNTCSKSFLKKKTFLKGEMKKHLKINFLEKTSSTKFCVKNFKKFSR